MSTSQKSSMSSTQGSPNVSVYVDSKSVDGESIKFTITNTNHSMANAIRRTIITDIPAVSFKTFPHEENLAIIKKNTTRLNNEILRQRLECIPIHLTDPDIDINDLEVEIDITNTGNVIRYVTTKDFQIKDLRTDKFISESVRDKIFPPDNITKDFIIFCRLRPKISNEIPGESIHITSKLSFQTAKSSGAYNVASVCAYHFTEDKLKQDDAWQVKLETLTELEKNAENLLFIEKDWRNHDAKRFYKENSFDFDIESVGVFSGYELIKKACETLIMRLQAIHDKAGAGSIPIKEAESTMEWGLDITLENESYTIGKVIEYLMNKKYFEEGNLLTFVGFRQAHPHDNDSFIRVAFNPLSADDTPTYDKFKIAANTLIQQSCSDAIAVFSEIASEFN
jgi:DNA-directed RNA polymerase subunit L